MVEVQKVTGRATARASAIVRLCAAREDLWRAEHQRAEARGARSESASDVRVAEATAELATREQWLHWIDRGVSERPEADGEWGLPNVRPR